ncbi:MAG: hypothetical protein HYS83_00080 [Candidatus Blackburnbacteria bacterium]|nr:hypothetical protein [Candidatus Blackburnbacteria bacterium]
MIILRRYWFFILLSFLAGVLLFLRLFSPIPRAVPSPTLSVYPEWRGVVPGKSPAADLRKLLGEPAEVTTQDGKSIFSFLPEEGGPPHRVATENDIVGLIREQYYGADKLEDFKKKYGSPEGELFGPYQDMGFKVFVFPEAGVAAVSSIQDGTTVEVWYFKPTTLSGFLEKWGKATGVGPAQKQGRF